MRRTVLWARRCKQEFERQMDSRGLHATERPLLFGVVHGGSDERLRRRCAEELQSIGFDGYGFGGWPLDAAGKLDEHTLAYTAGHDA